jgi:hypothetical protein
MWVELGNIVRSRPVHTTVYSITVTSLIGDNCPVSFPGYYIGVVGSSVQVLIDFHID